MSEQPPSGPYEQMPGQPPDSYPQGPDGPQYPHASPPPSGPYEQMPGQPPYSFPPAPGGPQYPYAPPPQRGKQHPLRKWLIIASAVFAGIIVALVAIGAAVGTGAKHAANPVAAQPSFTPATQNYDTSTPTPSPTGPDMLSMGQAETVGDASTSTTWATITVESATVTTQPVQSYGSAPANGYFVVVHVKATADPNYTDGFPINELDFYDLVKGSHHDPGNGNAYGALTDAQSNADLTTTLAAGETSSGWMAFDVPSRHGYIVYAPNADGQPLAEWNY